MFECGQLIAISLGGRQKYTLKRDSNEEKLNYYFENIRDI